MTPAWCTKDLVLLVGSGFAGFDALAGASFLGLAGFSLGCLGGGLTAGGFLLGGFMMSLDFLLSVPWDHKVLNYIRLILCICVCGIVLEKVCVTCALLSEAASFCNSCSPRLEISFLMLTMMSE